MSQPKSILLFLFWNFLQITGKATVSSSSPSSSQSSSLPSLVMSTTKIRTSSDATVRTTAIDSNEKFNLLNDIDLAKHFEIEKQKKYSDTSSQFGFGFLHSYTHTRTHPNPNRDNGSIELRKQQFPLPNIFGVRGGSSSSSDAYSPMNEYSESAVDNVLIDDDDDDDQEEGEDVADNEEVELEEMEEGPEQEEENDHDEEEEDEEDEDEEENYEDVGASTVTEGEDEIVEYEIDTEELENDQIEEEELEEEEEMKINTASEEEEEEEEELEEEEMEINTASEEEEEELEEEEMEINTASEEEEEEEENDPITMQMTEGDVTNESDQFSVIEGSSMESLPEDDIVVDDEEQGLIDEIDDSSFQSMEESVMDKTSMDTEEDEIEEQLQILVDDGDEEDEEITEFIEDDKIIEKEEESSAEIDGENEIDADIIDVSIDPIEDLELEIDEIEKGVKEEEDDETTEIINEFIKKEEQMEEEIEMMESVTEIEEREDEVLSVPTDDLVDALDANLDAVPTITENDDDTVLMEEEEEEEEDEDLFNDDFVMETYNVPTTSESIIQNEDPQQHTQEQGKFSDDSYIDRMDLADAYDDGEASTAQEEPTKLSQAPTPIESTTNAPVDTEFDSLPSISPNAVASSGIQIMITSQMRNVLTQKLGYTDEDVDQLRPEMASALVKKMIPCPEKGIPSNWCKPKSSSNNLIGKIGSALKPTLKLVVPTVVALAVRSSLTSNVNSNESKTKLSLKTKKSDKLFDSETSSLPVAKPKEDPAKTMGASKLSTIGKNNENGTSDNVRNTNSKNKKKESSDELELTWLDKLVDKFANVLGKIWNAKY